MIIAEAMKNHITKKRLEGRSVKPGQVKFCENLWERRCIHQFKSDPKYIAGKEKDHQQS
jgi:hypothetical protein